MNARSRFEFYFLLFLQIFCLAYPKTKYNLNFEYLLSDEKLIFELELYNKPKNSILDYGEDIFYSGKIESIEKYPLSKLVNFNKTEFMNKVNEKDKENNRKKEEQKDQILYDNLKQKKEMNKQKKKEEKKYEKQNESEKSSDNVKNENNSYEKKNQYYSLDKFQDIIEDPFLRMFFNDYYPFQNMIRYQNNNEQKDSDNYYTNRNYYYNNHHHNNQENDDTNKNIIVHHLNNNGQSIKIIKYPGTNTYQTYNDYYENENRNFNPFSIFDDFDFEDPFKLYESQLNNIYGIRFLTEKNKTHSNNNIFTPKKHSLLFIPSKLYFDYINYLPKSTIILVPKKYIKNLKNYEDYYIFTLEESASFDAAISKMGDSYHFVKIGQNFTNTNFIFISISITVIICFIGSTLYSYLLKNSDQYDILPVQRLVSKLPMYLCLLNIIFYSVFIYSYNEYEGYYVIIKYIASFLYSLFRSLFLSILTLLLNGWMTISFIGWAEKLNRIVPILIFEIMYSLFVEIVGFYDVLPFNKIQLYYFRNILENIVISSLAIISFFKFYLPLNQKCKYLKIINSDFSGAYNYKRKKIITFIIFSLFYSFISIYSNFAEFSFIFKYIQNDNLHIIRQIIFESIFNFIFIFILLPKELPYLYTEETDLLSINYFFSNLNDKNEILDVNNENIKEIKKEVEDNEDIPIVIVNPFFNSKNGFNDLHTGKISIE